MDEGKPAEDITIADITNIILNPDHDALKSFTPYDIPNGAIVRITSFPPKFQFVWKDGKVLDKQGREVGPPPNKAQSQPLVSKALPDLEGLGINLEPNEARNKVILVCFFDMNQRPSRNCVESLNSKAEMLAGKGVRVILVHAAAVDDAKLGVWVKKRSMVLPVGRIRENVDQVRDAWGVRSLPWLILTDRNHVVTAEGFGLEELDDRIKERENAKR